MLQAEVITQRVFKTLGSPLTTNNPQHTREDAEKIHRQTNRGRKMDYFTLDGSTIPWRTFTPEFSPCFFGPFPIIPTGSVKKASKCSTTKDQTKGQQYGGRLDQKICYEKTARL